MQFQDRLYLLREHKYKMIGAKGRNIKKVQKILKTDVVDNHELNICEMKMKLRDLPLERTACVLDVLQGRFFII